MRSGEAVALQPNLTDEERRLVKDVRWTHIHLVVSVKNNGTTCPHGRCKLMADGSLRFSHVLAEDQGNYWMQAFDERGNRMKTTEFQLLLDAGGTAHSSDFTQSEKLKVSPKMATMPQSAALTVCLAVFPYVCLSVAGSSVLVPILSSILPITVLVLIALIVVKRRQRSTTPGTTADAEQPDLIVMALCVRFISLVYCLFVCFRHTDGIHL